jgi:hypothetical protein
MVVIRFFAACPAQHNPRTKNNHTKYVATNPFNPAVTPANAVTADNRRVDSSAERPRKNPTNVNGNPTRNSGPLRIANPQIGIKMQIMAINVRVWPEMLSSSDGGAGVQYERTTRGVSESS